MWDRIRVRTQDNQGGSHTFEVYKFRMLNRLPFLVGIEVPRSQNGTLLVSVRNMNLEISKIFEAWLKYEVLDDDNLDFMNCLRILEGE